MDVTENAEIERGNLCLENRARKMEKLSPERRYRSSCSMERIEEKAAARSKRRRFAKAQLPTPPPDPASREIFPERVVPYENSASKAAARALGVEDAFDHLDKLHSMMKEILEIRERNAKLFRRVRHLERLRVTRKAHLEAERLITMGQDVVLPDEDVGFAESLLGAMLSSSFELSASRNSVGRPVGSARVARSRSIGMDNRRVSCPLTADTRQRAYNRSAPRSLETKGKRPLLAIGTPKVSKWTRVKAAFKWERAACSNTDAPTEPEAGVRYLKIPENTGGSSEISGPPTPAGTMSSSSSIDDVFHRPHRVSSVQSTRMTRRDENSDPSRRSRSLDGDASVPMNFVYSPRPRSKDNSVFQGKSVDSRIHKTPWGKVKDMMQLRRESIGRLPGRSISRNDDGHSTSSLDSSDIHRPEQQVDGRPPRVRITGESNSTIVTSMSKSGSSNVPNDFMDLASRRLTPTLTITVPSSEELRSISSPESVTPSPPSPRQSFESGKSDRYSQAGYETPKEIRTGQVSPASSSSGVLRYGLGRSKTCQGVPFAGDYKRQQSLKGESLGSSPKMQRRDSKWNKVKRAFLTSATSVPTSPNRVSSYFFDEGDATGGSYSASASAEDLENQSATSPGVQAEAERNYRLLHDKFGVEFYRKLAEWERLKSSNASARDSSSRSNARERDNENLRLLGEERLTPEFKKKLEEWKRMNKGSGEARSNGNENRSANRRRITDWQLWRSPSKPENKTESPRLSEDFVKKMEEWKRIKAATSRRETEIDAEMQTRGQRPEGEEYNEEDEDGEEEGDEVEEDKERPSNMGLSGRRLEDWKSLEDEEFRSLEMVLETMEMDRQTRLSKLQRIVGSQPQRTQEVLIHTSTGLYRFEGISQKFTRKLYEWEKSQGISPELSTFRLLDPLRYGVGSHHARTIAVDVTDDGAPRRNRHRSKSVGCVDIDSWRTKRENEKATIRRPCSLSLNDVDNIDPTGCIIGSSIPTIPDDEDTSEDIAMEDSEAEPEAVIVDIEDVIEETASPLRKYQPHQTPVYSVAGSETTSIAVPLGTVTARHEPSPIILIEPGEVHPLRGRACSINDTQEEQFYAHNDNEGSVVNVALPSSSIEDQQRNRSIAGTFGTKRDVVDVDDDELPTVGIKRNDESHLGRVADRERTERREDSDGNWQMAPLSHGSSEPRVFSLRERSSNEDEFFEDAITTVRSNSRHSKKLPKNRRLPSGLDTQVGCEWLTRNEPEAISNATKDLDNGRDDATDDISPSTMNAEFADNPNVERIIINADTLNKIVVPTASSSRALSATLKLDEDAATFRSVDATSRKDKREATSVFVKTKRIVFSPFRREAKTNTVVTPREKAFFHEPNESFGIEKSDPSMAYPSSSITATISEPRESFGTEKIAVSPEERRLSVADGPFSPRSPIPARSDASAGREKSPGVRMMIRRYELETDNCDRVAVSFSPIRIGRTTNSATSSRSGSSSPGWRTPPTESKWINYTDRYEEAKKAVTPRKIGTDFPIQWRDHPSALLAKSSSADFSHRRSDLETRRERTMEPEFLTNSSSNSSSIRADSCGFDLEGNADLLSALSSRAIKIRLAKENFLSMGKPRDATEERNKDDEARPGCSSDIGGHGRNGRIEENRSSIATNDIVKSSSVGMINVDEDTYGRLLTSGEDGAEPADDSLPPLFSENLPQPETRKGASRLSQIADKFKRARLRRAKEREHSSMSTVFKLCRQTLLVDVASNDSGRKNRAGSSRSQAEANGSTRGKNEHTARGSNDGKND